VTTITLINGPSFHYRLTLFFAALHISPMKSESNDSMTRRRPIAVRNTSWAAGIAEWLARAGLTPNQISVASIGFSAIGGATLLVTCLAHAPGYRAMLFVAAATCILLRLLCNLFDGMVAVEGGLKSKSGEIFNELPDRLSDAIWFACAGYAAMQPGAQDLGWAAAVLAVITAYVRTLGGQAGTSQQFCGPMAKQQRMFTLTLACLLAGAESVSGTPHRALWVALWIIVIGSVITIARRTHRIIQELERTTI
jgi:phosphatidylglycerophosphate synthase